MARVEDIRKPRTATVVVRYPVVPPGVGGGAGCGVAGAGLEAGGGDVLPPCCPGS
jgi:hypothetical protein